MTLVKPFWAVLLSVIFSSGSFSACSKSDSDSNVSASALQTHPSRGPKKAELVIEQFSDFICPYCKDQAHILKKVMEAYPGKMRMIFRHMPISGEPGTGSFPLHEASMCAAEQGKFWEFHDFVFSLEKKVDLNEIAEAIHLEKAPFDECVGANRYRAYVLEDMAEAQKRGVAGTPTFFVKGEQEAGIRPFEFFAEKLDPVFAKKMADQRKKAEEELLKRINPAEEGRPMAGPADAAVTIVEYSDFHCPFCIKLTATLKKIMETYPQDVRRVWRHYPLPIHPYSPYAHLASECAHQQGQFWPFHAKLFENQDSAREQADFERFAGELQLNLEQFKVCYDAEETKKKIENDVLLGLFKKVASTPTLFINGEMVIGAKPFEDLKKVIDQKLREAKK